MASSKSDVKRVSLRSGEGAMLGFVRDCLKNAVSGCTARMDHVLEGAEGGIHRETKMVQKSVTNLVSYILNPKSR